MTDRADPLRIEYGSELDGLQIVHQPAPVGAASFSATYVGPAGWAFDPRGKEGTSRLVNQLVTSAAGRYPRVQLAQLLDRLGATLARQCAPESAEVSIWGPATEWERLLPILADVVLRPRFDASDVARARRQMRERQLREATQPASRAEVELWHAVFPPGHPYRESGLGSVATLGRIARADLERFHRAQYSSGDALLVVTSAARSAIVERVARRLFRGFTNPTAPRLSVPPVRLPRAVERRVELPGRSQVEVRIGGPSIARSASEYPAAYLANEVLGGRPMLSRLFQQVREKGGLAYHASSSLEAMRFGGHWSVQAGTGGERYPKVVRLLRKELGRLSQEPVAPSALDTIRESAIGQLPLTLESTSDAHELAVEVAYHRLPGDYWVSWPESLRKVRPRELREAADLALNAQRAVTVLAGPLG